MKNPERSPIRVNINSKIALWPQSGKRVLLHSLSAALLASPVVAETYQFEVGGAFSTGSAEIDGTNKDVDIDIINFYGSYFFKPVDDSIGPLAETAFLNKASFVNAHLENVEVEKTDGTNFLFGGRWVAPEGYILEGKIGLMDDDVSESNVFLIGGGAYIDDRSSIVGSYLRDDFDGDNLSVLYESLVALAAGTDLKADLALGYSSPDEGDNFMHLAGGVDYYFNSQLSVGGQLGFSFLGDDNVVFGGLRGSYFINRHIQVAIAYDINSVINNPRTDLAHPAIADDSDMFSIAVNGRF